jgi:hypothetical protein
MVALHYRISGSARIIGQRGHANSSRPLNSLSFALPRVHITPRYAEP